jgi:hypothetical protein
MLEALTVSVAAAVALGFATLDALTAAPPQPVKAHSPTRIAINPPAAVTGSVTFLKATNCGAAQRDGAEALPNNEKHVG